MTLYDLMIGNIDALRELNRAGVKIGDINYIDAYADILRMKREGEKMTYIIAKVGAERNIQERSLWRVLLKFSTRV